MSWAVGFDENWQRDIGYGVPAKCDHPGCETKIDRGLAYVCCESEPYGGDGCGLYFCGDHSDYSGRCERCQNNEPPFNETDDIEEWINHKITDPSWEQWRKEQEKEKLK